ncbi:MAG: Maf family protein [Planctomycetota bacterium]|nr:Maf family protein [Planctomycetota bacterium]
MDDWNAIVRPPGSRKLVLGSASPRRLEMLRGVGFDVESRPPPIDDGAVRVWRGSPADTVLSLAWFKAAQMNDLDEGDVGLAADTVCVVGGRILGKPRDRRDARGMLTALQDGPHTTITGVCIVMKGRTRLLFTDSSTVEVDRIPSETLDAYLDGGEWRGKAGGYNLVDRVDDGWPIRCVGDPDTVMGLPMRRLRPLLERLCGGPGPGRTP